MLIVDMEAETQFLASVTKVLAKTKSVLEFYKVCPTDPTDLNYQPYVGALFGVCREHRKGFGGLEDLSKALTVFELFRRHPREGQTDEALAAAMQSISRYNAWLNSTFPEVRQRGSSMN
jgi:hypothetical protein